MRQLEAEADAIIQMVREGQRARRLQQAPSSSVSSAAVAAGSSVAAPHAPTGAATPAGTAAATTVSMATLTAAPLSHHRLLCCINLITLDKDSVHLLAKISCNVEFDSFLI